jgi:uncharacterized protein (TIGR00251 family)
MPGMSPRNPEAVLLHVRVQPKARANAVKGWHGAALRVSVTAAPEDGKANRAVIDLLAETFDVAPSSINLVRGVASRDKWFRLPQGVKIPG